MSDERPGRAIRVYGAVVSVILVGAVLGVAALVAWWGGGVAQSADGVSVPEVLLTAASLFILIFSVLVGLAAVFGWRGTKQIIKRDVQDAVDEELAEWKEELETEVDTLKEHHEASQATLFAYTRARLALEKQDRIRVVDRVLLDGAIAKYESTLSFLLEEASHIDDSPLVPVIRNNLAFLLGVRGEGKDGHRAKELVERLREEYPDWSDPSVLNTYACVVSSYADEWDNPIEQICDAWEGVAYVHENEGGEEQENARRHASRLDRAFRDALVRK